MAKFSKISAVVCSPSGDFLIFLAATKKSTNTMTADSHMYTKGQPSGLAAAFLAYMMGPDVQGTLIPSLSYAPVVK